jgi:hypothetical protein
VREERAHLAKVPRRDEEIKILIYGHSTDVWRSHTDFLLMSVQ